MFISVIILNLSHLVIILLMAGLLPRYREKALGPSALTMTQGRRPSRLRPYQFLKLLNIAKTH